jgi:hypothetical protein
VFEFLGQVNRLPVPGRPGTTGFVRPHEIVVHGSPAEGALPARLLHSATLGPVSRLEFGLHDGGATINVVLPRDTFRGLHLALGATAYLAPSRFRHFDEAPPPGS